MAPNQEENVKEGDKLSDKTAEESKTSVDESKQKKLETGFVMLLFRIGPLVASPARGGLVIDVFRLKIERLYLFATLALVEPLVDSE